MRNFVWALVALISCVSCSNDKPEKDNTDFSVVNGVIEASDMGGEFEIEYRLVNYVGSVMPAAVTDAEWVVDIDNTTKDVVRFRILPNFEARERETVIRLK